jgi:hypothetical protein
MPGSISGKINFFSPVLVQRSLVALTLLLSRGNVCSVIVAIVGVCGISLFRPLAFDTVLLLDSSGCCIAFLCSISAEVL